MASSKPAILVIEDDDNLRSLVAETLEDQGYEVAASSGPDEAVELARGVDFSLVLADVRMAGSTDGVGAIERIKAFRPRIRAVIMTGYASEEVPLRAARLQADDYLLKGDNWFGVAELVRVVARALQPREGGSSGLLERLVALARTPIKALLEARLPELEAVRRELLQTLFLLIRPGHLSRERALHVFRLLEPLELAQSRLESPSEVAPLTERYRKLLGGLNGTARLGFPEPSDLDEQAFFRLYDRVRKGELESEQLARAALLRVVPELRKRSLQDFRLYSLLWDNGPGTGPDNLVGRSFGGHQLEAELSSVGPVRRYRTSEGRLAEALPATPETRELLAREAENPRFLFAGSFDSFLVFVLPDGAADAPRTLADALPSAPLEGKAAWELLRPLFLQVQEQHANGNFCGLFGPAQALETSTLGYRLHDFGPGRFRWAQKDHTRLASCGLSLSHAAPELFLSSKPRLEAASDQYCLGVLWLRALLGSHNREALMLRTCEFLHRGQPLLSPAEVPHERLRAAVTILMAAQPAQRFPDMARAVAAFDECF